RLWRREAKLQGYGLRYLPSCQLVDAKTKVHEGGLLPRGPKIDSRRSAIYARKSILSSRSSRRLHGPAVGRPVLAQAAQLCVLRFRRGRRLVDSVLPPAEPNEMLRGDIG